MFIILPVIACLGRKKLTYNKLGILGPSMSNLIIKIIYGEAIGDHGISLPHVSSLLQLADIFTNAVPHPHPHHQFLHRKLMFLNQPQFDEGC